MSLADSPDRQFQSEDNALKPLFPAIEDPLTNSFDDYINQTIWDLGEEEKEDFFIGDVGDLFGSKAFSSGTSSQSPIGLGASARSGEKASPQPWRKGVWCLNRNDPPVKREVIEKPSHVDEAQTRLQILNHSLHRPGVAKLSSPPLTPSKKGTKDFALSPRAATVRQTQYGRLPISREVTLSPSPMYARLPNSQPAHCETWQQDFQNFHLRVRDESVPPSPPPSGQPAQYENATRKNAVHVAENSSQMAMPMPMPMSNRMVPTYTMNQPVPSLGQLDPGLYVPRTRPDFVANGPSMVTSPVDVNALSSHFTPQPQVQAVPSWPLDMINSGHDVGHWMYGSHPQGMGSGESQTWWSSPPEQPVPCTKSNFAPSHEEYYPRIAAPTPQRPVHQLVSSASPDFQSGGLMIQYPQESKPITSHRPSAVQVHRTSSPSTTTTYPPLPSLLDSDRYHHPVFSPGSSFTAPRRIMKQESPGRSTSASPDNAKTDHTGSRSLRQSSPTRSARRKSLGNLRACGVSKPPRLPRTPKTPNGGGNQSNNSSSSGAEMNFVNLTAADSAKLLSDVAPSGSSKTRARRDQEAKEKRRRLSEAAVRAVRKAGGDLKSLGAEHAIAT